MTPVEIALLKQDYEVLKKNVLDSYIPLRHSIFFWVFVFIALISYQFDFTYIYAGGVVGTWLYLGVIIVDFFDICKKCYKLMKLKKRLKEVVKDEKEYR